MSTNIVQVIAPAVWGQQMPELCRSLDALLLVVVANIRTVGGGAAVLRALAGTSRWEIF